MPASQTVAVRGLGDLQRAFQLAGKDLNRGLREDLKEVAEPVRVDAERRAVSEIRNINAGQPWSEMRAVARKNLVYVAPVQRGSRARRNPALKRRNLAPLLMDRAMAPALAANAGEVAKRFDKLLARMESRWEHG